MKKKYVALLVLLVALLIGGWYGYREYNRRNEDLHNKTADYRIGATDLISSFEKDSAAANRKYTGKTIAVSGNVKSIDSDGNPVVIALGDNGQMSSVQCSMDSSYADEYKAVKEGDALTVKGKCTGGRTEDLFGTDVILNYCVIDNKK